MTSRVGRAALITLILPAAVAAQPPRLEPGLRVRVEAPLVLKKRLSGTLMSQSSDTIRVAAKSQLWVVPVALLKRLDVHAGTSHIRGLGRGALYGAATLAGLGIPYAINSYWEGQTTGDKVGIVAAWSVFGAFLGAGVGLLMGVDDWKRVFP